MSHKQLRNHKSQENTLVEISRFEPAEGVAEYHVMIHVTQPSLTYQEQLDTLLDTYYQLLENELKGAVAVFKRYFLSDAANQADWLAVQVPESSVCACSIVEQPPLNGTKIALWVYLQSGVLYVGAPSEVEMKEKKDRVDDALCATRAAIEEGIIPGGGVAYIRAIKALEGLEGANADETTGINIVKRAIEEPLRQIVENAGLEGSVVVEKVRQAEGDFGYNAREDKYENMKASGIIDPAKVTRVALENAASIAGMFLTTECVICDKKEEKADMPMGAPGMGGMGGMM